MEVVDPVCVWLLLSWFAASELAVDPDPASASPVERFVRLDAVWNLAADGFKPVAFAPEG